MEYSKLLDSLKIGNSVAEFDSSLERYFVETGTFRAIVRNERDIIAGDKGTGKSALFKILSQRYRSIPELKTVEIIPAFNVTGNPAFQRLTEEKTLTEGEYIVVWKSYVLSLIGNWLLEIYKGEYTKDMRALDEILVKHHMRDPDNNPTNVFARIVAGLKKYFTPKSISMPILSENALVTPTVEFREDVLTESTTPDEHVIAIENYLRLLNNIIATENLNIWLVLDRLDEAFQRFPETEIPALRALFRTYLDMLAYDQIRMKVFVRKDLFERIIATGFVNLTHINAKKIEIVWDDDDLLALLCRRIRDSKDFISHLGLDGVSDQALFDAVFPEQVTQGSRRPKTWKWIVSRIRDGNDVKPPRNLIDLVNKSQEAQQRSEDRSSRTLTPGQPVIEGDSLSRALNLLSRERVTDTLVAEAGTAVQYIERFRDGKAEHNDLSVSELLGLPIPETKIVIKQLLQIGFLESIGGVYKVPHLYRDGLNITQGKAFQTGNDDPLDVDE